MYIDKVVEKNEYPLTKMDIMALRKADDFCFDLLPVGKDNGKKRSHIRAIKRRSQKEIRYFLLK